MDSNLILLFIAIVFLPGIVWTKIDSSKSTGPKPPFGYFIADSFVYGFLAYILLIPILLIAQLIFLFVFSWNLFSTILNIGNILSDIYNFSYSNLVVVSLICTILTPFFAKLWSKILNTSDKLNEIFSRYFRYSKNLETTGGLDVWTYALNQDISNYEFRILDFGNKRCYQGKVYLYSGNLETKEVLLGDVTIFGLKEDGDNAIVNGKIIDKREYLYLSFSSDQICMEYIRAEKLTENQPEDGGHSENEVQSNDQV